MLLLCWNLAGRLTRMHEQAEAVLGLGADMVCLQEVTPATRGAWSDRLGAGGYHVALSELPAARESSRPLGVRIAARTALEAVPVDGVPWPERVLAARVPALGGLEAINVHSPISPKPGMAKVRTHEAVFKHLTASPAARPRLLCGDLNTPRREHADGSVWTFARTRHGKLRPDRGERWDAAETALIRGLEPHGFRDAFRARHGHELKEVSWEWPGGGGYRLDHLIVSADIEVEECHYLHEWRSQLKLSDHSPLVAGLTPR